MKATPHAQKQTVLVAALTLVALSLLYLIYVLPTWWVSLTAPNYPKEAFPDGVRIEFHMNGVFNGCKKVEKKEISESVALDCVHEMDTINHYVGMYPIAAGGPIERGFSQFLITFLGVMLLGFMCIKPKIRMGILALGFGLVAVWMYLTLYGEDGFKLENAGYVEALVTSLDQEAGGEGGGESSSGGGIVEMLRKSLEASGVKIDMPGERKNEVVDENLSRKDRLIDQLRQTYERDHAKGLVSEPWNGSTFQIMAWHYGKSLGRYFNNQEEIRPMVKHLKLAINVVFWGLIGAMLLLIWGARKNGGVLYWLLVIVPMALPVFFVIDYSAWLWWYGHTLNSMGAFSVKPFMPTVFGDGKVAQFATHSYPDKGFFVMLLLAAVLAVAALIRRKAFRGA